MMYNDCVVIPGWGALIANYKSSSTSDGLIEKPRRVIGFNASINHNDGTVATSLMRRHGMSYPSACNFISDSVTTFHRHLAGGTELAFGHLGYFKLGAQNLLEFVPMSHDGNSSDEFFGLADLPISSLAATDSSQATLIEPVTISWRERMKVAASIAAIVGVGLLLSTPVIIDRSTQTASLNIAEVKQSATPLVIVKPASQATAADNQFVAIDNNGNETAVARQATEHETEITDEAASATGTYSLVLETCHSQRKAEKLSRRYSRKGIHTMIQEHEGDYRLVVAQSSSKQELLKIKEELPAKCRNAKISRE